jgi:hypothetical protein
MNPAYKKGRPVPLGKFLVNTIVWDSAGLTLWERLLYVEYCTHRALNLKGLPIIIPVPELARRFHCLLGRQVAGKQDRPFSEKYLTNTLYSARKDLAAKGLISLQVWRTARNREVGRVWLTDNKWVNEQMDKKQIIAYLKKRKVNLEKFVDEWNARLFSKDGTVGVA